MTDDWSNELTLSLVLFLSLLLVLLLALLFLQLLLLPPPATCCDVIDLSENLRGQHAARGSACVHRPGVGRGPAHAAGPRALQPGGHGPGTQQQAAAATALRCT